MLSLSFFLLSISVLAQEDIKSSYDMAQRHLRADQYGEAYPYAQRLAQADSTNAQFHYLYGMVCLHLGKKEPALTHLERAATAASADYRDRFDERKAPELAYFMLGRAYQINYRFEEAIAQYSRYRGRVSDAEVLAEIDLRIFECKNGAELITDPVNIIELNLGDGVNSRFNEHSPVVTADESMLVFTSQREGTTGGQRDRNGLYYEDIFVSYKVDDIWQEPQPLGGGINTPGHEASIGLSIDGQSLFIYRDADGNGDIFEARRSGDSWTNPERLNANINTKYRENHASLSADGNRLYFTSDRKDGIGGLDIYLSEKEDNGDWGPASNLGPTINTPADEHSPYLHPDGFTLYFSSSGHGGLGGLDILKTELLEDGTWREPTNIGYPINTPEDDVFYVPTLDGKRAYYASAKPGAEGQLDIYLIEFPDVRAVPITLLSGFVESEDGQILEGTQVTVIDMDAMSVVGIGETNQQTGQFMFVLKPEKNYYLLFEHDGFLYFSDYFYIHPDQAGSTINYSIELEPVRLGQTMQMQEIGFKPGTSMLDASGQLDVEKIVEALNAHEELVIEISHSKNELSVRRYQAIVAELGNISASRLRESLRNDNRDDLLVSIMDAVFLETKEKTYKVDFNEDGTGLSARSKEELRQFIDLVKRETQLKIEITEANSNDITKAQTSMIVDYLVANGIEFYRISTLPTTADSQGRQGATLSIVNNWEDLMNFEVLALESIYFEFDQSTTNANDERFSRIAEMLLGNPGNTIVLTAHADSVGSSGYNVDLSKRRAEFVKKYLISRGVSQDRITIDAKGESLPIALNSSSEGRTYNRRVDVQIFAEGVMKVANSEVELPSSVDLRYTVFLEKRSEQVDKDYFAGYRGLNNIRSTETDGGVYYHVGRFQTLEDARSVYERAKSYGFEGAEIMHSYELDATHINQQLAQNAAPSQPSGPGSGQNPSGSFDYVNAGAFYSVQVMALSSPNRSAFKDLEVNEFQENGLYKYTYGQFSTYQQAMEAWQMVSSLGYHDAFIRVPKSTTSSEATMFQPMSLAMEAYTVQVKALKIPVQLSYFNNLPNVQVFKGSDGLHRYVTGEYASLSEAESALSSVIRLGYRDAFVAPIDRYTRN